MPTFVHGSKFIFKIGTAASETDITSNVDDVKWPRTVDKADTTTGGLTSKQSIPGLKDSTIPFKGKWDPTIHTTLTALLGVAGKSVVYGPAGSTTGNVKSSVLGYLSKYEVGSNVGAADEFQAEFTPTGDITDTVF